MALPIQYDLFEPNDEISLLRKEIEAINDVTQNVRRGVFARLSKSEANLLKMIIEMQAEIDELKRSVKKEPPLWLVPSHPSAQIVALK